MAGGLGGWLLAFAVTEAVEAPIYLWALPERGRSRGRRLLLAAAASAMTHPWVYWVWPRVWPGSPLSGVLTAEAFAVAVEAWWLSRCGVSRSVSWALAANAASVAVGWALGLGLG